MKPPPTSKPRSSGAISDRASGHRAGSDKECSTLRGRRAEQLAARFLTERDVRILEQNYRCHRGEIDLIALDGETLCFVEVRYRLSAAFGAAIATVNAAKRRRIVHTAAHYLTYRRRGQAIACRFDIVTIEGDVTPDVRWWKNVFDAGEPASHGHRGY